MGASEPPDNIELRAARKRLSSPSGSGSSMSRQELADACNRAIAEHRATVKQRAGGNAAFGWAGITGAYIGCLERGDIRWPNKEYRTALRDVLGATDGELGFYIDRPDRSVMALALRSDTEVYHAALTARRADDPFRSLLTPAGVGVSEGRSHTVSWQAQPGRFFSGAEIVVQAHPAIDDGRVLTTVPRAYAGDPFLAQTGRALVVGCIQSQDEATMYGLDARTARRRLRSADRSDRLPISHAYALDDFTTAVLWAIANLDEALLADDALLEECRTVMAAYEALPTSAASRDLAIDLNPAARMFIGSAFCAGHITRHATTLTDVPVFWTREQAGEEASAWLLFAHKNEYLRATADQFGSIQSRIVRAFCVPPEAVDASPRGERILLLLAIALMESYGINVAVTDNPIYASIPGFVSDHRQRAIVANWVGDEGIWHVDVTDRRNTVREYADAAGDVTAHSVVRADGGRLRVRAASDYLRLDWSWLRRRCADLAPIGIGDLARPRSRHLSVAGVDRACRYIAGYDTATS